MKKGASSLEGRNVKTSLWYNDPPNGLDRALNRIIGLTLFTQSDFRTLTKGDVKIVSACLSPTERRLFIPRWPFKLIGIILIKTIIEAPFKYIRHVRKKDRDYFDDLVKEYNYYLNEEFSQQSGAFPTIFKLTSSYGDIDPDSEDPGKDVMYVFFSLEGCHVFNNGGLKNSLKDVADQQVLSENIRKVKENIQEVKRWDYRPLYVSMAHHMNNDLCGHARSLPPYLRKIINQRKGMGGGFTDMGKEVLHELLDEGTGRIYIDIKHMSAEARQEYYKILDTDDRYIAKRIPVLASHGAVNGRKKVGYQGIIPPDDDYQNEEVLQFNQDDINYFDDEINRIEKSGGFLGIQLDERRLCSKKQRKLNRRMRRRSQQLHHHAGLVWKQIRYIAEVLDKKGKCGWGTATIGSDYDGLVDPPNGYWTSDDFGILEENLVQHATNFFEDHLDELTLEENKLQSLGTPQDKARHVIDLFMRGNAQRFLEEFYR